MFYLKCYRQNTSSLHTIIGKKSIDNWTYIVAVGYGGGGAFEEFCGKFRASEKDKVEGFYSLIYNPDEWEYLVSNSIAGNEYSDIDVEDKTIIEEMNADIWENYVFWDDNQNDYQINKKHSARLKTMGYFTSLDWDNLFLDFISRDCWGLSLTF